MVSGSTHLRQRFAIFRGKIRNKAPVMSGRTISSPGKIGIIFLTSTA